MNETKDIFGYIVAEESAYSLPISVNDWDWSMKDHIKTSFFYKHGRLLTGNDDNKPVKNIIRPILNLEYRAEDIDVKDIILYIDDKDKYYLSFLVKKYHDEVFVKENDLDTFFDELKEEKIDFGGGLAKNVNRARPEVVPLQSIAFCDQTDILSGPIGIRHYYSPDQLMEMEQYGWGNKANGATTTIEELITLAQNWKMDTKTGTQVKTPGKYIEVYEVHGTFPNYFLKDDGDDKYTSQLHIVGFYTDKSGRKTGLTLFKGKEKESPFKFIKRDKIYGRALGFGGVEELFEPQVWTNYSVIRMKELLDSSSKNVHLTDDEAFYARNKNLNNVDNNQVLVVGEGKTVKQMDTYPRSIALFEKSINEWEAHARQTGSAQEAIMGEQPPAGTPFSSVQFQAMQSSSTHLYRRGKYAKDIEKIYQDWIIPYIVKEIIKGQEFLATLDLDELQMIGENLTIIETNKFKKNYILDHEGQAPTPEMVQKYEQQTRDQFKKKGNKHFIGILKGEMKDLPIRISINVAGKQKNLGAFVDKIVNIFRFVFSNPQGFMQIMQIPGMSKSWNEILEFSGLSPMDFYGIDKVANQPIQTPVGKEPLLAPTI